MIENSAPAPHTAFARVNQSARWNSRIIEKRLEGAFIVMNQLLLLSGAGHQSLVACAVSAGIACRPAMKAFKPGKLARIARRVWPAGAVRPLTFVSIEQAVDKGA